MTSRSEFVIGIDPGLSGAVAFYNVATGGLATFDMPVMAAGKGNRNEVDLPGLLSLLDELAAHGNVTAYIERVHAMPRQGVTSVWRFAEASMAPRAILAALHVPVTLVTPQAWKRALSVPAAKDGARARAGQLMPRHAGQWPRVKDDGRAEAALIALYGARQMQASEVVA